MPLTARTISSSLGAAVSLIGFDERLLQRVAVEAFDRDDVAPGAVDGEQQAGIHRAALEEHGAGAAVPHVARLFRAGEPEVVAKRVEQRAAGLDRYDLPRAVYRESDRFSVRHGVVSAASDSDQLRYAKRMPEKIRQYISYFLFVDGMEKK